jgi:hypothetical protein
MEQVVCILLLLFLNGILLRYRCNYLGGTGIELSLYMSKIQIELDCETQFCLEINFNLDLNQDIDPVKPSMTHQQY